MTLRHKLAVQIVEMAKQKLQDNIPTTRQKIATELFVSIAQAVMQLRTELNPPPDVKYTICENVYKKNDKIE